MPLTDDEIKALLAGTEGTTPGPWSVYREHDVGDGSGHLFGCEFPADAAHIARCDPTTIAELCTRLLSAEAENKRLREALIASKLSVAAAASARVKVLEEAGSALIADVKRRHPGEELRYQYMRALDAAVDGK
jgi:hypothetical protein